MKSELQPRRTMTGPWTFFTLVGLLVLVQLCNSQKYEPKIHSLGPAIHKISPNWDSLSVLQKILGSLHRINEIITFKILDEEDRRSNLESQIAKTSQRRKCRLHNLLFGEPCPFPNNTIKTERPLRPKLDSSDESKDSQRNVLSQRKRRPESKVDSSVKKDTYKKNNLFSANGLFKRLFKKGGNDENLNDETDAFNDDEGLGALNDDDNGPGALNDEIDGVGGFNDETDGLNEEVDSLNFNDDTGVFDDDTKNADFYRDETDGFDALNDEDSGPGALNDEDKFADAYEN